MTSQISHYPYIPVQGPAEGSGSPASPPQAFRESIFNVDSDSNLPVTDGQVLAFGQQRVDGFVSSQTLYQLIPVSLYITEVDITLSAAPGASNGWIFRFHNILKRTSAEVRIEGTNTTGVLDNPVYFDQGDWILQAIERIGTPTTATMDMQIKYKTQNGEIWMSNQFATEGSFVDGVKKYSFGAVYGNGWSTASSVGRHMVMPCAGTFGNLTLARDSNVPTDSFNATLAIVGGGASMKATINNTTGTAVGGTGGGVTRYGWTSVETLAVTEDDILEYYHDPTGTPLARGSLVNYTFLPTVAGETPIFGGTVDVMSNSVTEYMYLRGCGTHYTWTSIQADRESRIGRDVTLSNFHVHLNATPVNDMTFKFKNITKATEVAITVTAANFDNAFDKVSTLVVEAADLVVVEADYPTGGTARLANWSCKMVDTVAIESQTPQTKLCMSHQSAGVSDTGFTAKIGVLESRNDYQIVVSENSDLSLPVFTSSTLTVNSVDINATENYYMLTATITGLTADTQYYYGLRSNSTVNNETAQVGLCKTSPTPGVAPASTRVTRIAMYSCLDVESNAQTGNNFKTMLTVRQLADRDDLDLVVDLGDRTYDNLDTEDSRLFANSAAKILGNSPIRRVMRKNPVEYQQSDHCSGPDDNRNDATGPGANAVSYLARKACYDAYENMYNIAGNLADTAVDPNRVNTWARYVDIGRIRVILLDTQAQRWDGTAVGDGTVKSGTGWTSHTTWDQRQWVSDTIEGAKTANMEMCVVYLGGSKSIGSGDDFDTDYVADFTEWCNTAVAGDAPLVVMGNGDAHNFYCDAGTGVSAVADITVGSGKIPWYNSAPLHASTVDGVPTASGDWNGIDIGSSIQNQYSVLEITDNPAEHEVTFVIRNYDEDGIEINTASSTVANRTIDFAAATSSVAHPGISGTATVTVNKASWFGKGRFAINDTGGTLTQGTDYTFTPDGDAITDPNADTVDIVITFVTATTGTITFTLSNHSGGDSRSTVGGTQSTHTITLT